MSIEKHQVAAIIDSAAAFDIYHDSTGLPVPEIPDGMNTLFKSFSVIPQGDTAPRAAMLIRQRGFEQTLDESAHDDEVNGLSVYVATDADEETGHRLLADLIDHIEEGRTDKVAIVSVVDERTVQ